MTKSPVFRTARSQSRLASWPLVCPSVYRFVPVISGDTSHEERCPVLTHVQAATRECPLSGVAKSHGGPGVMLRSAMSVIGAPELPKMCLRSQGQNNTNRSLRARDSAPSLSLSVSLTLLVARASLALSAPVTELWYGTCIVYVRRERVVRRIAIIRHTPLPQTLAADRRASSTLLSLLVGIQNIRAIREIKLEGKKRRKKNKEASNKIMEVKRTL